MQLKGVIEKKAFVNKAGREISEVFDLFFITHEGQRIFIKTFQSAVTKATLIGLVGKEIEIEAEMMEGLWDTNNRVHQSRTGEYLAITSVKG